VSDLAAEIRSRLEYHKAADIVAGGVRDLQRVALDRVLEECDRCERGDTMMAPSIIRSLIATELGVTKGS
jgi:hypothetical protein